jgi:hypothetical protein
MSETNGEMLVEDYLSRYGLRDRHVMRMGGRVDRERWLSQVPVYSQDYLTVIEREEKDLGIWNLNYCWPVREAVNLVWPEGETGEAVGVFWFIGKSWYEPEKKASVREAADWAAMTFEMAFKRRGQKLLVGQIRPEWKVAAGEIVEVEGDGSGPVQLVLVQAEWIPVGFIVVV